TDLSGYLRSALDGGECERVPLRDEVCSVRNYLAIEERRCGERLRTTFGIDSDAAEKDVPVFLLQPLVENAIRHNLETSWKPCHITITAHIEDSHLCIEVANTGCWREPGGRKGI